MVDRSSRLHQPGRPCSCPGAKAELRPARWWEVNATISTCTRAMAAAWRPCCGCADRGPIDSSCALAFHTICAGSRVARTINGGAHATVQSAARAKVRGRWPEQSIAVKRKTGWPSREAHEGPLSASWRVTRRQDLCGTYYAQGISSALLSHSVRSSFPEWRISRRVARL